MGPAVIDLSHHNPTPDWGRVQAAGVVGVIFKATEDTTYKDPTRVDRARGALNAGLSISTYHFMRPSPVKDQMEHYLSTVDPVHGERMCLDHEDNRVPLEDLEEAVSFLKRWRPDLQVTIYSGHLIKEQLGTNKNEFLADNTSLWIAQYTSAKAPKWPKQVWPHWSLWQYTDKANVDGISKPVDGNRWNGPPEKLKEWFGGPVIVAPPVPAPSANVVEVALTVPVGFEVRITINGEPI